MKQKQYLLFRGWLYAVAVIAVIVVTLIAVDFSEIDSFGITFGIAFLLFLSYRSFSCFKQAKNTAEEKKVFTPTDAPAADQITYFKRLLLIGIPAFILLSIWIIYDLNSLESGTEKSVSLWAPIAFLYNSFGYWVAVLTIPVLGCIVIVTLLSLIRKSRKEKTV